MHRREALALLASLAACSPAARPARSSDEPLTRAEARARLAELATAYEESMAEHGLHEWSRYAGKEKDASGASARMEALRKREQAIFDEAKDIVLHQERTLTAPRLAELWKRGALGLTLLGDPRATELADELEQVIESHEFTLDHKLVTRGELTGMRESPDARVRQRTRGVEHALHVRAKPIAVELMKRRAALARENRVGSFHDALLELRGVSRQRLDTLMGEVYGATQRDYAGLLARLARAIRKRHVEPWDVEFAVRRLSNEPADERFPAERAIEVAFRVYRAFGIDLENPKLDITIRDFAFGGQAISIRVPNDVRLVVRPTPGARFYGTLLHELGHAFAATRTVETHPLYKAYEWVPGLSDPGFAEGIAEVFGRLLDEPRVLTTFMGLSEQEALRLVAARRLQALVRVRRIIGGVWFERTALERPEADLDRLSLHIEARHGGVHLPRGTPPVWATSPFNATYPAYTQSYLLAMMMATQIRASLRRALGEDWISPAAGSHLRERAVADGARLSFDEKMIRASGEKLSARDLVRFVRADR